MQLEQVIPYRSKGGNEYLIKFEKFEDKRLPDDFVIPIIDISLVLITKVKPNDTEILSVLTTCLLDYLNHFDVILYYYSDTKDIIMRGTREMLPQQFRHELFSKLFEKYGNESLIIHPIIITDNVNGDHFISLIAKQIYKNKIEIIEEKLCEFHK
jgi:hypothetical protein